MSAEHEQTAKLPPRILVRIAWVLHRALYRFTGGRIGLRLVVLEPRAAATS
jgi:hypothetical protein